jgi:uncharacterized protein YfiM (DUF2279 family)
LSLLLLPILLLSADTGKVVTPSWRPTGPAVYEINTIAQDRLLGEDKMKHFALSYMITVSTFGAARTVTDHDASVLTGAALGAAAGIVKEIYDKRNDQSASTRDLLWDAAGVAVGVLIARQTR